MNTDPAYVAEQTGKLIDAFLTTEPLEPLLDAAKTDVCTEAMGALV
ncbi:MAG TPA: molybdenum cofactor biosynthesis protein MoaE, partial [Corynebacterium glutamicum]|nr:molybdenum cofactor biosynthesis protein MoaE [Corynebacterium glutamicum]